MKNGLNIPFKISMILPLIFSGPYVHCAGKDQKFSRAALDTPGPLDLTLWRFKLSYVCTTNSKKSLRKLSGIKESM